MKKSLGTVPSLGDIPGAVVESLPDRVASDYLRCCNNSLSYFFVPCSFYRTNAIALSHDTSHCYQPRVELIMPAPSLRDGIFNFFSDWLNGSGFLFFELSLL